MVSPETRKVVASVDALKRDLGDRVDKGAQSISMSVRTLQDAMQTSLKDTADAVGWLSSTVADGFLVSNALSYQHLVELQSQTGIMQAVARKLDELVAIHETLKNPRRTAARELCNEGLRLAGNHLYADAVRELEKAAALYDVDYFIHDQLGSLYLMGTGEYDNVIDINKALEHLRLATRYGSAERNKPGVFKDSLVRSFLLLARACLVKAGELHRSADGTGTMAFVEEASGAASEALRYATGVAEAHYLIAVCSSLQKDSKTACSELRHAISIDRSYSVLANEDHHFDHIRQEVTATLEDLRAAARADARRGFEAAADLSEPEANLASARDQFAVVEALPQLKELSYTHSREEVEARLAERLKTAANSLEAARHDVLDAKRLLELDTLWDLQDSAGAAQSALLKLTKVSLTASVVMLESAKLVEEHKATKKRLTERALSVEVQRRESERWEAEARTKKILSNMGRGAAIGAISVSLPGGCIWCFAHEGAHVGRLLEGLFGGAAIGAALGAAFGLLIGLARK